MPFTAKWIWARGADPAACNQAIVARRTFRVPALTRAVLRVTADTWYRLSVNDAWVSDGPCRSWPEHYQYDVLDIGPYLRHGRNVITITAVWLGIGTFQQVPRHPGLLAELMAVRHDGRETHIGTDAGWEVARLDALKATVPRTSVETGLFEHYDARQTERLRFRAARVFFEAEKGPWKDLHARDCPLLTRQPSAPTSFRAASVVSRGGIDVGFPLARLIYPGTIEANISLGIAAVVATIVRTSEPRDLSVRADGLALTVNGEQVQDSLYRLRAGDNFLLGRTSAPWGLQQKEAWVHFESLDGCALGNPLWSDFENPWCFSALEEGRFLSDDLVWPFQPKGTEKLRGLGAAAQERLKRIGTEVVDARTFRDAFAATAARVPSERMLMEDPHAQFRRRRVLADAADLVADPHGAMADTCDSTTIIPSPRGDLEVVYDLGEQRCGYFSFELEATEGTVIDLFAIEHIADDGDLQHTLENRNGLRYVCRAGTNRFTSFKRRSGRYLFLTVRDQRSPVRLRLLQMIDSTYPVSFVGSFRCSDPALDRIWDISARTLKLCMEDTFTDCPLYEQTLWVGDARNEALFALSAFGAEDLVRRFIRLTAQSLERFPMVGCQVPSSWGCLLPAWSFLWVLAVRDYHFYSGDAAFLAEVWPRVMENLRGARGFSDERGLFSGPFWNMFDWSPIDEMHETVLHNSMLLVAAIDAARECAEALGDQAAEKWLSDWRRALVAAVNGLWDDARGAYPDSVHADGTMSLSTCQHTSFLSLLYDIVPAEHRERAIANTLVPPAGMARIGSPFAIFYFLQTLERLDRPDLVMASIRENYMPMLRADATTVWEVFPNGTLSMGKFPTRSHCHGWSAAPLHFLNRLALGIRQVSPGGSRFSISPWIEGLDWARGNSACTRGRVTVTWERQGRVVTVDARAPEGTVLSFERNRSHEGLEILFNGSPIV